MIGLFDSISEKHGLEEISLEDVKIYSVGISTAGNAEIQMAKKNRLATIVATTIDPEGAKSAAKTIAEEKLSHQIEVKLEDISHPLPYQANHFHFIYARLVLHYLPRKSLVLALAELHRVLRTGGKIFVVVRSNGCQEAQNSLPDPETELTTYTASDGSTYQRFFHSVESISSYLSNAGFRLSHVKTYEETLCHDFQRKKLASKSDALVEVLAFKGIEL